MIDVKHQINAVQRAIGSRVLEAGEARVLTISQTYNSPVDDVWDACTNPERIPRWFLPVSGDLRVGGRYQIENNANGVVERCEPTSGFSATWEFGGEVSWIEVRLTDTATGTLLTLEHTAHVDDERWSEYGPGAVGVGWDGTLMGLGLHLASGAANDPHAIEAWAGSDGGRQFYASSSARWCEASIAFGTPRAAAEAAAGRTTAFYTGVAADDQPVAT